MSSQPFEPAEATWSIAAAARATGLTQHTLRAWERRFGFPVPHRLPSGHRRFTREQVERLKLIKHALLLGHRASAVVPLPVERVSALLPTLAADAELHVQWCESLITQLKAFDLAAVTGALRHAAAALGVGAFLRQRLIPLLIEVGRQWELGQLDIRHEHLLSEIIEDELRVLRVGLESGCRGRPLLLTALPGEQHGLPLHIVALAAAARGQRTRLLGLETPPDEIVEAAHAVDAQVVGITVSTPNASLGTVAEINRLHAALAPRTTVWVGGSAAGALEGVHPAVVCVTDFASLEEQLARLANASTGELRRPSRGPHATPRRP